MSNNPIETKPKPQHIAKANKFGLLRRFIIFMIWVVFIGLLISLVACQQNEPTIFVIKVGSL